MGFIKIRGYLCNFMKGNYGIKNYMGVQEEGIGVEEEFVHLKCYSLAKAYSKLLYLGSIFSHKIKHFFPIIQFLYRPYY